MVDVRLILSADRFLIVGVEAGVVIDVRLLTESTSAGEWESATARVGRVG